jgi:hypothetical protein
MAGRQLNVRFVPQADIWHQKAYDRAMSIAVRLGKGLNMNDDPAYTRRWLMNASGTLILSNAFVGQPSYAQVAGTSSPKAKDQEEPAAESQFLRSRSRYATMSRAPSTATCLLT